MSGIFSAFAVPDPVAEHLAERLAECRSSTAPDLRRTPREQWHVTVGYYGRDDPDQRLARLTERVSGLRAPRLRMSGSGTFAQVCLLKIATPDPVDLRNLAEAADFQLGGHPDYLPHVTVARWSTPTIPITSGLDLAAELRGYDGPQWVPDELVLYASHRGTYTPIGRVPLLTAGAPGAGC
ncbi:2'-5' RNA ligase family protein [Actinokineospora diospyrosa]|uniref:2'-5' RNA ligase n=1 Tax=Actinokineospora diospyrosa TaxID=103728 RepID=A0ABT1IJJ2_9PSEU|nr:2'-5' RNA ligase family protein [Actinokineospora diospyrosa]MCP2272820.1 2'-5' RNA ligase [Actinokineospora diospyrosa]